MLKSIGAFSSIFPPCDRSNMAFDELDISSGG